MSTAVSTLRSRLTPCSMQKTSNSFLVWTTDQETWGKRRLYEYSLTSTIWSLLLVWRGLRGIQPRTAWKTSTAVTLADVNTYVSTHSLDHRNQKDKLLNEENFNTHENFSLEKRGNRRLQLLMPMSTLHFDSLLESLRKRWFQFSFGQQDSDTWGKCDCMHFHSGQRFEPNSECRMIAKKSISTTMRISA